MRRARILLAGLVFSGCVPSAPPSQSPPSPMPLADAQRLAQCQVLADRAHITAPILTQGVIFQLAAQTLRDHGVLPPRRHGHAVDIHRVTQADIQAAADELKPCFPPL